MAERSIRTPKLDRAARAGRGLQAASASASAAGFGRPKLCAPRSALNAELVRLRGWENRAVEVRSCAVKSRAVSNRRCVVAAPGGEQRNENDQSVTPVARVGDRGELDLVGVAGRARQGGWTFPLPTDVTSYLNELCSLGRDA